MHGQISTRLKQKARYFPTSSFLQAELGSSLSLIWRALLWGRDVLHDGFVGRVGNGNSIRVFHNKWIPNPFTFKKLMNNGLNWDAKSGYHVALRQCEENSGDGVGASNSKPQHGFWKVIWKLGCPIK
ncbi:unnamed protein product [Prunus armeniaca]